MIKNVTINTIRFYMKGKWGEGREERERETEGEEREKGEKKE